ncbi:ATP-binding cassette domain-containing protein [Shewanella sp. KT0246]|uniref:ATP-binding cassette domain-containing protein n=1 Tax=Shewanella sp. KT0246 TaxID=2815912 RepID=UPI001BC21423|nr:ABC transporter ATP-binding protein [Shewanella sp. KT0246]GIU53612.1 ABC transporter [Shewanella sp. KT0246]
MTLLALHEVVFRQYSATEDLFHQLNFSVSAGECHCICGVTGAGKSTLLQLMAMPSDFDYQGEVIHHSELRLGLVMQDPNVQLIRESIGAEVAFGLENIAISATEMIGQVEQALKLVGLDLPLDSLVINLSLGQKYRLMLAAQLVLTPNLILIDEPWAQLDNVGVKELVDALKSLIDSGVSVIMTEHHSGAFAGIIDTYWLLDNGLLKQQDSGPKQAKSVCPFTRAKVKAILPVNDAATQKSPSIADTDNTATKLTIFPLTIQFKDAQPLLQIKQTLHANSGDLIGVFGENGCGKSSLLNQIVGIDNSNQSDILFLNKPIKLGSFGKDLGFLMQRPSRQLFEMTVMQELEFSLKRFGLPLAQASEILTQLEISHIAHQSPHKLSYGQQHLVALASVLCIKPKLLLLDDPFAGLDNRYFSEVIEVLKHFLHQGGAIIVTSHRPILENLINKSWQITDRELTEQLCNVSGYQELVMSSARFQQVNL